MDLIGKNSVGVADARDILTFDIIKFAISLNNIETYNLRGVPQYTVLQFESRSKN